MVNGKKQYFAERSADVEVSRVSGRVRGGWGSPIRVCWGGEGGQVGS